MRIRNFCGLALKSLSLVTLITAGAANAQTNQLTSQYVTTIDSKIGSAITQSVASKLGLTAGDAAVQITTQAIEQQIAANAYYNTGGIMTNATAAQVLNAGAYKIYNTDYGNNILAYRPSWFDTASSATVTQPSVTYNGQTYYIKQYEDGNPILRYCPNGMGSYSQADGRCYNADGSLNNYGYGNFSNQMSTSGYTFDSISIDTSTPIGTGFFTNLLNNAWQQAAGKPGYNGAAYKAIDGSNIGQLPTMGDKVNSAAIDSGSVGTGGGNGFWNDPAFADLMKNGGSGASTVPATSGTLGGELAKTFWEMKYSILAIAAALLAITAIQYGVKKIEKQIKAEAAAKRSAQNAKFKTQERNAVRVIAKQEGYARQKAFVGPPEAPRNQNVRSRR